MKSLTLLVFVAVIAFAWAQTCTDGESKNDGCNQCTCTNGIWACTQKLCVRRRRQAGECTNGEEKMQDCNHCKCINTGWACTRKACPKQKRAAASTPSNCNPGERFKYDCNWCTCAADGHSAACSYAICPQ